MSARVSQRWALLLIIAASILPLAVVAWGSSFARYTADDYYIKHFSTQLGWWGFIVFMYTGWTGTFSSLALQGLVPSPQFIAIPILLMLVMWLWLLYLAVRRLLMQVLVNDEPLISGAIAFLLLAVLIYTLPNLHQALFWYTSAVPYTLPLVVMLLNVLWLGRLKSSRSVLIFFVLNFVLAGFNPIFTSVQVFWLGLLLLFNIRHKTVYWQLISSLLGALISFTIVLVAPGNANRIASSPVVFDLGKALSVLPKALEILLDYAFLKVPFGTLALLLIPAIFAFYFGKQINKKVIIIGLIGLFILAIGSAAVSLMPRLYAFGLIIPARSWTIPLWSLLCPLAAFGYLLGLLVRADRPPLGYLPRYAQIAAVILVIGVTLNGMPITLQAVQRQAAYAAVWDERDAYLRTLSGSTETVRARSLHGAFELEDLTDNPNHWSNINIALYYNLSAIVTDDQPPFVP